MRDFFRDCLAFEREAFVPVRMMRAAYDNYAKENGIRYPLGAREFNRRLEARGCQRAKRDWRNDVGVLKPTKCRLRVRLRSAEEETVDDPTAVEDQNDPNDEIPF